MNTATPLQSCHAVNNVKHLLFSEEARHNKTNHNFLSFECLKLPAAEQPTEQNPSALPRFDPPVFCLKIPYKAMTASKLLSQNTEFSKG